MKCDLCKQEFNENNVHLKLFAKGKQIRIICSYMCMKNNKEEVGRR